MGLCASSSPGLSKEEQAKLKAERAKSQEVDKALNKDAQQSQTIHKLLLLGAGESGKSTLFKQMVSLHGKGWSEAELKGWRKPIRDNVIEAAKILCNVAVKDKVELQPDAADAVKYLAELKYDAEFDEKFEPRTVQAIQTMWADPGIQSIWARRSNYQLNESASYFLNKVADVARDDYVPSEADLLRARVRTTGIVEQEFHIDNNRFQMFDVGGQRNERKKWIHCFQDVTAVLFVAAISEYDQKCWEDDQTARIEESLKLFDEIVNSQWFTHVNIILFLNKVDLFKDKLPRVPLNQHLDDYPGDPNDYNQALRFIQRKFESKNKSPNKMIYTHPTCATDKDNVRFVFHSVRDTIIRNSLRAGGLDMES